MTAPLVLTRALLPDMLAAAGRPGAARGSNIVSSGWHGLRADAYFASYVASKLRSTSASTRPREELAREPVDVLAL